MTLILWKAPVTDDLDEVERLVEPYYKEGNDRAFEPSLDLASFTNELLQRYPSPVADEPYDGPWADGLEGTDRVLFLSIRWKAENSFIDAIVKLANKHELVLYDPQGPDITLPGDPVAAEPVPPPRVRDHLAFVGMALVAAAVFWLGWTIDVPVLRWVLMIVAGFFLSVIVFLLWILLFGAKEDETRGKA